MAVKAFFDASERIRTDSFTGLIMSAIIFPVSSFPPLSRSHSILSHSAPVTDFNNLPIVAHTLVSLASTIRTTPWQNQRDQKSNGISERRNER